MKWKAALPHISTSSYLTFALFASSCHTAAHTYTHMFVACWLLPHGERGRHASCLPSMLHHHIFITPIIISSFIFYLFLFSLICSTTASKRRRKRMCLYTLASRRPLIFLLHSASHAEKSCNLIISLFDNEKRKEERGSYICTSAEKRLRWRYTLRRRERTHPSVAYRRKAKRHTQISHISPYMHYILHFSCTIYKLMPHLFEGKSHTSFTCLSNVSLFCFAALALCVSCLKIIFSNILRE